MKKIFNYLKSLFTAPTQLKALENRINVLETENKRLNNNFRAQQQQLDRFGSLLNVGVDVHVKHQDSIAFVTYPGPKGMEGKIFEIGRHRGMENMFRFLEDFHVPAKNVYFDAAPGHRAFLKQEYEHQSRRRGW